MDKWVKEKEKKEKKERGCIRWADELFMERASTFPRLEHSQGREGTA